VNTLAHGRAALETVLGEIRFKRERQQSVHGWTIERDDHHTEGELAQAAISYIQAACAEELGLDAEELGVFWPWTEPFEPKGDRRELLLNAAALLVAELERLDRPSTTKENDDGRNASRE
jgi:hypothetical protein